MNPYQPPPPPPPGAPMPANWPAQVYPRPVAYPRPVRIEPVPGEGFGLAILPSPKTTSGVAIGSMTSGIGSILIAVVVWCFGYLGAEDGWGGLVSGAFCVLASLLGLAGLVLGGVAMRQIRLARAVPGHEMTGRGMAITGMICGGIGLLLALAGVAVAIALSQGTLTAGGVD